MKNTFLETILLMTNIVTVKHITPHNRGDNRFACTIYYRKNAHSLKSPVFNSFNKKMSHYLTEFEKY